MIINKEKELIHCCVCGGWISKNDIWREYSEEESQDNHIVRCLKDDNIVGFAKDVPEWFIND